MAKKLIGAFQIKQKGREPCEKFPAVAICIPEFDYLKTHLNRCSLFLFSLSLFVLSVIDECETRVPPPCADWVKRSHVSSIIVQIERRLLVVACPGRFLLIVIGLRFYET